MTETELPAETDMTSIVEVVFSDGTSSAFHHLWLRSNCLCAQCLHPQTRERTVRSHQLDPQVRPVHIGLDNHHLAITWTDGHVSVFALSWLQDHRYDVARRPEFEVRSWDSTILLQPPTVDYGQVICDDAALLHFAEQLWCHGVTFVRATPSTNDAVLRLAERVGFIRATNFGRDFEVVAMVEPNNVAYTSLELCVHTDAPNTETPPGIQFLHCLVADAPGGESTLVDGYFVAEQIRRDDPIAFDILTTVAIPYRFHDDRSDIRSHAPVIGCRFDGTIGDIRFHDALMEPLDVAPELVEATFRALRLFDRWCQDPAARIERRLEVGEIMVFHNRRVLHGRRAFDPVGGARHLHGCYVDTDEWLSRIRVLRRTIGQQLTPEE